MLFPILAIDLAGVASAIVLLILIAVVVAIIFFLGKRLAGLVVNSVLGLIAIFVINYIFSLYSIPAIVLSFNLISVIIIILVAIFGLPAVLAIVILHLLSIYI